MFVYRCRNFKGSFDIEDFFMLFLMDSFDSDFVYIISPWITPFKFTRKVVYYPFISSYNMVDVLTSLKKNGVKVFLLTRCFDDFLSPDTIYMLHRVKEESIKLPQELYRFLADQVSSALYRLNCLEEIISKGIECKFDLGLQDKNRFRLHAKIYVNNKYALIGSANFTRSGVVRNGNWECLLRVESSSRVFKVILDAADKLYDAGRSYDDCQKRILQLINNYLKGSGIVINGIQDLKKLLKEILYRFKYFVYAP